MSRVELRLLGGFDARLDGADLSGFESQKSRALLAYLALNRDRQVERRLLSGLLWSERSEVSARRNLRQALHNIRTTFGTALDLPPVFTAAQTRVQLNPELDCWIDVEIFRQASGQPAAEDGDVTELAAAARLYVGDLLAGFDLGGCPVFEEWLREEQERLRRAAVAVYQRLVATSLESANYRAGIDYAHRLLTIDPTSEQTHRELMQLYSRCGHHSRALTQYRRLHQLLESELGVEPMPETTELYQRLLAARDAPPEERPDEQAVGPVLPLEGRAAELRRLRAHWQEARDGHGGLTLLVGEEGIGKTRLARSFLAQVAAEGEVSVRATGLAPSGVPADQPIRRLLDGPAAPGTATALFVDDLQWANDDDREALLRLVQRITRQPVWVLACCRSGVDLSAFHRSEGNVHHLSLDRLHPRSIHAICSGLLDLAEARRLSHFVAEWSGGSPLVIAQLVDYLWDAGLLASRPTGGWTLDGQLPSKPPDFEALIGRRLRHLPASARRLLVLAAVLGPRFDRTTLVEAGDEHPAVVDACLELLLDRWLIRWASSAWTPNRPGPDVERWTRGHREGAFEFAHDRVRLAVLATLDPRRVRELRRQVRALASADKVTVHSTPPRLDKTEERS